MKAVINNTEDQKYPCLKVHQYPKKGSTVYVLFEKPGCGTPVHIIPGENGACGDKVGQYSSNWVESVFSVFSGSITLSND